ncbi:cytidylyltransferase domain-containing protein [Pseudomonas sp. VI4.1]|uniref:cytidylyltransferase domain-containing protein n=1 Tax=Pseudomonas sp. VI4.1 TaxID=1941346 RepID=UPI0009CA93A6|nr:hypothetical protein [Pseudomonas sp. VI4.1]OPK10881.1 hypothetical protein BZ163_07685 [Pseudomonas sp. VI4.1]
MKVLAVIPARGGSKGIPRKSIRPLAGKPMIYYAIQACKNAIGIDRVIVTTDDDEIALLSERFGANIIMRPQSLAIDSATLDPVIAHATEAAEKKYNEHYDIIITVQPTSPLVLPIDLEHALDFFRNTSVDTVLSVVDDRHLCWTINEGKPQPTYTARVNRQQLPKNYRETGAVIGCTRNQLKSGSRIGNNTSLLEIPQRRSFDIDTFEDLYLCESILKRKRVVFSVVGYPEVGLGHAYRATMLAHELVNYDLYFVCENKSKLAGEHISKHNYNVHYSPDGKLFETIKGLAPDLVINDILDTSEEYIKNLKSTGCRVVNFEDLGAGYPYADLVINALYPGSLPVPHALVGPEFFCLRDEFLYTPEPLNKQSVDRILITFGGVDEGNLTARITNLIAPICIEKNIALDIVTGPGYSHQSELSEVISTHSDANITLASSTSRISDFMYKADVAITSGGRTVLELASLLVPTIVICQNERETTHSFASEENGIINLGYRLDTSDVDIVRNIRTLVENDIARLHMISKLRALDLSQGKKRVISQITSLIKE